MSNPKLYLDLINLTVGNDGTKATGYKPSEIYLIVQGRIGTGKGPYAHLDWTTGQLKTMSTADNTEIVKVFGGGPVAKYAKYWITLEDLLTKDYYDQKNGLQIPIPIYSGRLYLSFSAPVYISVLEMEDKTMQPAEPNEANTNDPNYKTIWDKFEFTSNTDNVLYSNTTAVDFVGIPMAYSIDGNDTPQQGFAIDAEAQKDPFGYLTKQFSEDREFSVLVGKSRLYAPKIESPDFSPFGRPASYMDAYANYCWNHYFTSKETITIWNYVDITKAEIPSLTSDEDGKGSKWTAEGKITDSATGTLTFTLSALEDKFGKALTLPEPKPTFSIGFPNSWDILRQGGVFVPLASLSGYLAPIDGDIKNQVSTALNRNVMHGPYPGYFDETNIKKGKTCWADRSAFYEENGVPKESLSINKYGKILHELSLDKLCYALAYDDKYSQNVNLAEPLDINNPTVMKLSIYYKKTASSIGSFPTGSVSVKDRSENEYKIEIQQDTDAANNGIVISINPTNGDKLTNCVVMYSSKEEDNQSFNAYMPTKATDNKVQIPANILTSSFWFGFRFDISEDQFLLPKDSADVNGHIFLYDPTQKDNALTVTDILNTK